MQHILYLNYNFFPPEIQEKRGKGTQIGYRKGKKKKGYNKKRYFPPHPFSHPLSTLPILGSGVG